MSQTTEAGLAAPAAPERRRRDRRRAKPSEIWRRRLNVVVALMGIIITAPFMLLVALLVRLDSPGPAIYKQPRVGLDRRSRRVPGPADSRRRQDIGGRVFTIYKFRTMTTAPARSDERWATRDDRRITRLGRVLRATRIDELPQLFNVLKGDMNIVGPRPEQPKIFDELRREVHAYPERQKVLPGITGLAQVNLGYDTSVEDVKKKVELDLDYIDRRSVSADLAIMMKTMPVMVFQRVWM